VKSNALLKRAPNDRMRILSPWLDHRLYIWPLNPKKLLMSYFHTLERKALFPIWL